MSRVLKNTLRNVRRTPYQALVVVLVLTLTFFVGQVFALISLGSQEILQYFETRPQVTAFFEDTASESEILSLQDSMRGREYVDTVTYVSKQEALKIYQEQNQDDPLLLEMVTADILPASLEVSATDVEFLPQIREELEGTGGVEEVIYHQDVVDALRKWTNGLQVGGMALVGYLGFTSLLVITIVISMKISSKRKEIGVMRLLGAKPWFIKGPFVIEGALYGLLGGIISWGLTYLLLLYATPVLVDFLGTIQLLPVPTTVMLIVLGVSAGAGMMIGMISGFLSSRRFAKA